MTDRIDTLRGDLAYMRELVQEGDGAQRARGGAIMASGGFIFAGCSALVWTAAMGWLPVPPSFYLWAWIVAWAVFMAALFTVLRRAGESASLRARASGVLWAAVGSAIGVIVLSCLAAQMATGSAAVWAILPSTVFALYGAGWTVAASLSGRGWERLVAVGAFAGAVAIAFLSQSAWLYLAYAAGLTLLAGLPGLAIMRGAPPAKA